MSFSTPTKSSAMQGLLESLTNPEKISKDIDRLEKAKKDANRARVELSRTHEYLKSKKTADDALAAAQEELKQVEERTEAIKRETMDHRDSVIADLEKQKASLDRRSSSLTTKEHEISTIEKSIKARESQIKKELSDAKSKHDAAKEIKKEYTAQLQELKNRFKGLEE